MLDNVARHLARHPYLALGVSAGILSIALPFIIFMVFAIATVIMTFTGFVIVEGDRFSNERIVSSDNSKNISLYYTHTHRHFNHNCIRIAIWFSWRCFAGIIVLWHCTVGRLFWLHPCLRYVATAHR